jgi:hypothetical protein
MVMSHAQDSSIHPHTHDTNLGAAAAEEACSFLGDIAGGAMVSNSLCGG